MLDRVSLLLRNEGSMKRKVDRALASTTQKHEQTQKSCPEQQFLKISANPWRSTSQAEWTEVRPLRGDY